MAVKDKSEKPRSESDLKYIYALRDDGQRLK